MPHCRGTTCLPRRRGRQVATDDGASFISLSGWGSRSVPCSPSWSRNGPRGLLFLEQPAKKLGLGLLLALNREESLILILVEDRLDRKSVV